MDANHKPKVFQVLGGPEGGWGGGGAVVLAITKQLIEYGCPVWVQCLSKATEERFTEIGAKTVTSRLWRRSINPLLDIQAFWELFKFCKHQDFDIVNTHTSKAGILGRIAARLAGVPLVIYTAHGFSFNEADSKPVASFYTFLERFAARFCDLIISVNEEERLIAIEKKIISPDRIVTVLNGIDMDRFENVGPVDDCRAELDPIGEAFLIGTTGRLMPQKGYIYLVEAMPFILEQCPQVKVVFAGEGPLQDELKGLADSLGVASQCQFLGFRDDIPEFLAAIDIFVLPSLWEGLSISLLEAMAAGKPIVVTNIKGNRETIDDGINGLMVEPADPESLADAIVYLAHQPQRARDLGQKAQEKARKCFSEKAMVTQTLELYASNYHSARVGHQGTISWSDLQRLSDNGDT
jgi:glycosyltransferase involved in cell wall biosynthesis